MIDRKFTIDFTELAFLAEACIPPRPIARSMFWHNLIDVYYEEMTPEESERLWEWLNKNPLYKEGLENKNVDCLLFEARYNPDNQYLITTEHPIQKREVHTAFLYNGRYHTSSNKSLLEEYIINIFKKSETFYFFIRIR